MNQGCLLIAEVDLQAQTLGALDYGPDRCVQNLIIQANLDAVSDSVFGFVSALGHGVKYYHWQAADACAAIPLAPLPTVV